MISFWWLPDSKIYGWEAEILIHCCKLGEDFEKIIDRTTVHTHRSFFISRLIPRPSDLPSNHAFLPWNLWKLQFSLLHDSNSDLLFPPKGILLMLISARAPPTSLRVPPRRALRRAPHLAPWAFAGGAAATRVLQMARCASERWVGVGVQTFRGIVYIRV